MTSKSLKKELLNLTDEFSEFTDQCAFLCDAFSSIAAKSEDIDQASVNGFDQQADWLKQEVQRFSLRLHQLQRQL